MVRNALAFVVCLLGLALPGCVGSSSDEVVVYTALDREFSEPIFEQFTAETGIQVRAKYDTESTKTVGLTQAILAEAKRPRCDLFWNNEVLNTLRLDQRQLLASYSPVTVEKIPESFRGKESTWFGFAARARVLLVNNDRVAVADRPTSIRDLVDPRWQGKVGIAKPLFGTTASHAAVLFATWGDEEARKFFLQVRDNAQIMAGNKQVAQGVASGELAWGLTDTDDAIIEIERGAPVTLVFPDQQPGGLGTLLIPNSVALIADGPHPEAARLLMDYLLSSSVEERLAQGASAQIPLRTDVTVRPRIFGNEAPRAMEVDFAAAAEKWNVAATFLRDTFH